MTRNIPQDILDDLTDVEMPRLYPEPELTSFTTVGDHRVPTFETETIVVGSGAAGLRAAIEVKRRNGTVALVTQSAWGGTSACSGSDKQTLHTANTSDQGDNYVEMARALREGGAMDEDTAYIEAVGSSRAMASLQYLGLPLPQDPLGGTLRYKTDHDEVGRATSCGPRTSRLMVKVLAQEALKLDIPFFNQTTAVKILTQGEGADRKVVGLLAIRSKLHSSDNPLGLVLFRCASLVLAAGGPGELYRDSVFPNGCFGALGLALEAGLELVNLTESQFGIGTRREGFPWNLSGTYVQAMPYIYALDARGNEINFLADYYRTTRELASNVFRKGYQWPFHATRMLEFNSSLVDLAIFRESAKGHRVYMDFNRNPKTVHGCAPFDCTNLDDDVRTYIETAGATQALPIDRLRHMNPLAIELYRRYKIDLATEPLEFAVNNQHMNGGIAVDAWARTNIFGLYAIGEAAGTHGVTRPGGAALNAGQVFGTRAAEHIASRSSKSAISESVFRKNLAAHIDTLVGLLHKASEIDYKTTRAEIQSRMSDAAGMICSPKEVADALAQAQSLTRSILENGMTYARPSEVTRVLQWYQMALASEAVLTALDHYIENGGGSRGARAICDPNGDGLPLSRLGSLDEFRFRSENSEHKGQQIFVRMEAGQIQTATKGTRTFDPTEKSFFERDWPTWLTGKLFDIA